MLGMVDRVAEVLRLELLCPEEVCGGEFVSTRERDASESARARRETGVDGSWSSELPKNSRERSGTGVARSSRLPSSSSVLDLGSSSSPSSGTSSGETAALSAVDPFVCPFHPFHPNQSLYPFRLESLPASDVLDEFDLTLLTLLILPDRPFLCGTTGRRPESAEAESVAWVESEGVEGECGMPGLLLSGGARIDDALREPKNRADKEACRPRAGLRVEDEVCETEGTGTD